MSIGEYAFGVFFCMCAAIFAPRPWTLSVYFLATLVLLATDRVAHAIREKK